MKLEKDFINYFKKKYGATISFKDDGYVFAKVGHDHLALPAHDKKFTDIFEELIEFCEESKTRHQESRRQITEELVKSGSKYGKVYAT